MRPVLLIAAALLLPLPALAQDLPSTCTVTLQCTGTECTPNPGVTLHFETVAGGIVAWDADVPQERIELTGIEGEGPRAWAGRAPDLSASVLITQTSPTEMRISMHSDRQTEALTAHVSCGAPAPAPGRPSKG